MKNHLCILLIILPLMVLAACTEGATVDAGQIEATPAPTPAPTPEPVYVPRPTPPPVPTPPPAQYITEMDYFYLVRNFEPRVAGQWIQITGRAAPGALPEQIGFRDAGGSRIISISNADHDLSSQFAEGQYVTATGMVELQNFFTNAVYIKHTVLRDATAEEVERLHENSLLHEEARTEAQREFRANTRTIPYDRLVYYTDYYAGEYIRVTIIVEQIFETAGIFTERGVAGKDGYNEWSIRYDNVGTAHFAEGDTVTFYGIFNGLQPCRMGGCCGGLVPHMTARYHSH